MGDVVDFDNGHVGSEQRIEVNG
ncbi:hypothetical protein NTGBS_720016 [Candidatus Nitrotoga sp. BS]|nr:hypothetical protein NTGBS_720016 [Candidatus Nitrotoga sp. BS]